MRCLIHLWRPAVLAAAVLGQACAGNATAPATVPMRPPTPASVTRQEPGGDAVDPERAALERLLAEPWGARSDKDEQLLAPMPDWEHWKRVRYHGFEHLVGFRYGREHRAMTVARVQPLPAGTPVKSETCMRAFEDWARPRVAGFDVKLSPFVTKVVRWRGRPLVLQSVDGWVSWGFGSADFSAAWAAYPAYDHACLIYGIAVPWRDHGALARRVRDRFMNEGLVQLQALTESAAYRHPPPPPEPAALPSAAAQGVSADQQRLLQRILTPHHRRHRKASASRHHRKPPASPHHDRAPARRSGEARPHARPSAQDSAAAAKLTP